MNLPFNLPEIGGEDRNILYENLPIIIVFVVFGLMMLPMIPSNIKGWLLPIAFIAFIISAWGSDFVLRDQASQYLAIEMTVRPINKKFWLYVKEPQNGLTSKIKDKTNQIYITPIELGEKITYRDCGKVSQIELEHELTWEQRMIGFPGSVTFRGVPGIKHNKVMRITAWEPKTQTGRLDSQLLEWIPRFIISQAPRDWELQSEPASITYTQNGLPTYTDIDIQEKIANLETKAANFEERAIKAEQRLERITGLARDGVNAVYAGVGKTRDLGKLVLEQVLTAFSAHTDINEVVKEYKSFDRFKFTKYMMGAVIGCVLVYGLVASQPFRDFLNKNIPWLAFAGIAGVLAYLAYTKGRGK